jgi:hypothetical protein
MAALFFTVHFIGNSLRIDKTMKERVGSTSDANPTSGVPKWDSIIGWQDG